MNREQSFLLLCLSTLVCHCMATATLYSPCNDGDACTIDDMYVPGPGMSVVCNGDTPSVVKEKNLTKITFLFPDAALCESHLQKKGFGPMHDDCVEFVCISHDEPGEWHWIANREGMSCEGSVNGTCDICGRCIVSFNRPVLSMKPTQMTFWIILLAVVVFLVVIILLVMLFSCFEGSSYHSDMPRAAIKNAKALSKARLPK